MEEKTVRLQSDDGRWLEMRVQGDRAIACVNGSEPFPFSFENLGFAARGLGYQAWGANAYFTVRHVSGGVALEFQGPGERAVAVCRLSDDRMREMIDDLDALAPLGSGASLL